jgi:hypothetical protein
MVWCDYRPDEGEDGFERIGIFVRDSGRGNFDSSQYGGGNCYCLTYDTDDGRIRAGKVVNGVITDFLPARINKKEAVWREFRIDCKGEKIKYYVDGSMIHETTDSSFSTGHFGIGWHEYYTTNSYARGALIENFVARSL